MLLSARRFPPQWTIEEHNDACFIVRDAPDRRSAIYTARTSRADALLARPDEFSAVQKSAVSVCERLA
jgi:hypothetical protein